MWDELKPVPTNPLSQRFVDTYAGFEGESELLWRYWDMALKGERLHDELPIYGVPGAGLIAYIDTGPEARRMPWQTPDYYEQQEASEPPQNFNRHHNNWWTTSTSNLINIALWDSLELDEPLEGKQRLVVTLDAAVSGDCCAITGAAMLGEMPVEVETHIFEPPMGGKMDYAETLRPCLDDINARHYIVAIRYDPYQLHDFITQLKKVPEYAGMDIEEFSQQGLRLKADSDLVTRIRQGNMRHSGNPELKQHLQNANGKTSGEGLRIVKKSETKKIDGAVTLSMAIWSAVELLGRLVGDPIRTVGHNLYQRRRR
jgi:phage terminase large subunit-like protein